MYLPAIRIIKIPILNHHLRLYETGLRPFQRGQVVSRAIVADTNATFHPPMRDIGKPRFMLRRTARLRASLPKSLHRQAFWYGNLLSLGREVRVLGRTKSWRRRAKEMRVAGIADLMECHLSLGIKFRS